LQQQQQQLCRRCDECDEDGCGARAYGQLRRDDDNMWNKTKFKNKRNTHTDEEEEEEEGATTHTSAAKLIEKVSDEKGHEIEKRKYFTNFN